VTLIASDIDGTILPRTHQFSPRTIAAFAALAEADIPFVLITARPPRWMDRIAASLGIAGEAVCGNGAITYDMGSRSIVDAVGSPADVVIETVTRLREAIPGVLFAAESTGGVSFEPGFPPREEKSVLDVAPIEQMSAVLDGSVFKLLALDLEGDADHMLALATPLMRGLMEVSHSSALIPLLEFAPPGISKATGLARVAASHGIGAADVIAFGDAPNDIPMLEWAGTSYAVGNAHQDVKAAATAVIDSVDDDGVAQMIERFLAG
jgi:Cof subfamily protein (haloacid dehalogenase superfamily)